MNVASLPYDDIRRDKETLVPAIIWCTIWYAGLRGVVSTGAASSSDSTCSSEEALALVDTYSRLEREEA